MLLPWLFLTLWTMTWHESISGASSHSLDLEKLWPFCGKLSSLHLCRQCFTWSKQESSLCSFPISFFPSSTRALAVLYLTPISMIKATFWLSSSLLRGRLLTASTDQDTKCRLSQGDFGNLQNTLGSQSLFASCWTNWCSSCHVRRVWESASFCSKTGTTHAHHLQSSR